ncbi:MAG: hypothetical protein FWG70_02025 [Oscillospiraceae bacterium]|nr:hypothetical protein [Oscillospiraceae bacterium]
MLKTERGARDVSGYRQPPHYLLTEEDIRHLKDEIEAIGADKSVFMFNVGTKTGFFDRKRVINVKGDVFPDFTSTHPRDLMSERAVLAHEYYGHFSFFPSSFKSGDWRDEMRASYIAAIKTPNLSDKDRTYLMLDAYERAKEAGHFFEYSRKAREIIYGYSGSEN